MIRPTLSCQTIEAEKCLAVNSVRCCLWNDSRCYKAIVRQSFLWRGTLGRCWTQAARWRTRPPPPPVRWLTGPILLIQTATLINKWRKLNEPQGLDHNFFSFILQKHKQRKYWIKWIRRKQTEKVSLIYSPTEGTCQKKSEKNQQLPECEQKTQPNSWNILFSHQNQNALYLNYPNHAHIIIDMSTGPIVTTTIQWKIIIIFHFFLNLQTIIFLPVIPFRGFKFSFWIKFLHYCKTV